MLALAANVADKVSTDNVFQYHGAFAQWLHAHTAPLGTPGFDWFWPVFTVQLVFMAWAGLFYDPGRPGCHPRNPDQPDDERQDWWQ